MPFLLVLVGAVLLISALRNTQGDLAAALEQDVPAFTKWGLALGVIAALGFVPGMERISRWLLALVIIVLVLNNYQQFLSGITSLDTAAAPAPSVPTPASAYLANPQAPTITQAQVSGTGTVPGAGISATQVANAAMSAYEAEAGFGGFV
jgi:hypothetical protein